MGNQDKQEPFIPRFVKDDWVYDTRLGEVRQFIAGEYHQDYIDTVLELWTPEIGDMCVFNDINEIDRFKIEILTQKHLDDKYCVVSPLEYAVTIWRDYV